MENVFSKKNRNIENGKIYTIRGYGFVTVDASETLSEWFSSISCFYYFYLFALEHVHVHRGIRLFLLRFDFRHNPPIHKPQHKYETKKKDRRKKKEKNVVWRLAAIYAPPISGYTLRATVLLCLIIVFSYLICV